MSKLVQIISAISGVAAAAATTAAVVGITERKRRKFKYIKEADQYQFWDNSASQAISQPNIGKMIEDWMAQENTDGKAKKVAFIGYDGCRADTLVSALKSGAEKSKNLDFSGHNEDAHYSGIAKLKRQGGGVYLAYAGGHTGASNQQFTSTAPGWASILTGVWGEKNGVINNGFLKNMDYKTFLLKFAEEKGLRTAFLASWEPHFTENYALEVKHVKENSNIPMEYTRIEDDTQLHQYMLDRLTVGSDNETDALFGIYEGTDYNGHGSGFGNQNFHYVTSFRNEDEQAYELICAIENRSTYEQEDWLIVLASDHGGISRHHGGQTLEERITWVACNKKIDSSYFANGFDGYCIK